MKYSKRGGIRAASAAGASRGRGRRGGTLAGLRLGLTLLTAWPVPAFTQDAGFLSGIVVDDLTGLPIEGASISMAAVGLSTRTDREGQFQLDHIARGDMDVRFEAPGYATVVERLQLSAADFARVRLGPVAGVLDELQVRAGRRRPAGLTPVAPSDRPWKSVLDLLEELPGVTVMKGGGITAGAFLMIRGASSFRSDVAPVIYVDGVQVDNQQVGRDAYHSLELISAETVARVRVLKSPAETSAYPMGANGVVVIETHRGGAPRAAF